MLSKSVRVALFLVVLVFVSYGHVTAGSQLPNTTDGKSVSGFQVAEQAATCNNIALGKPTSASAAWPGFPSSQAVDGNPGTLWNAGTFAPQWIEINLGSPAIVDEIRLQLAQYPNGVTTHEIWVADSSKVYTQVETVSEFTTDGQLLDRVYSPSLTSIQWIKVITTAGPSWVAWLEIEVCGTLVPVSTPTNTPIPELCDNIALGKPTDASASWPGFSPSQAVDGNPGTLWNAGTFAPQWIEINFGSLATVDEIRLYVNQSPVGSTTHEIWVADSSKVYTQVETISGFTTDGQLLDRVYSPSLTSIQWIKVITTSSPSWVAWLEIEVCGTLASISTPTSTATSTPTGTPTNTPRDTATATSTATATGSQTITPTQTPTSIPDLEQLKLCQVAANGVVKGQIFTVKVGNTSYNVPAGYCILAGQHPLNTQLAIQETIPTGYFVSGIEVKPSSNTISKDKTIGNVVIKIGDGVTEVIFRNSVAGTPTITRTPVTVTNTPKPTRTPCGPDCTPTPTHVPNGRLQICKEADGAGVSGDFTFRFETRSRTVPVGACALIISVNAGTLLVTEDARPGYVVSDVYTIPAGRLISKNLSDRSATVTIVEGTAASQTIIIFVNRAVTSQQVRPETFAMLADVHTENQNPVASFVHLLRNDILAWFTGNVVFH